jgi:hypothetical protein
MDGRSLVSNLLISEDFVTNTLWNDKCCDIALKLPMIRSRLRAGQEIAWIAALSTCRALTSPLTARPHKQRIRMPDGYLKMRPLPARGRRRGGSIRTEAPALRVVACRDSRAAGVDRARLACAAAGVAAGGGSQICWIVETLKPPATPIMNQYAINAPIDASTARPGALAWNVGRQIFYHSNQQGSAPPRQ